MARWTFLDRVAGTCLTLCVTGIAFMICAPRELKETSVVELIYGKDIEPAAPVAALSTPPSPSAPCTPRTLQLTTYDMGAPFSDLQARCPAGSTPTIDMRELLPGRGTQLVLDCACVGRG